MQGHKIETSSNFYSILAQYDEVLFAKTARLISFPEDKILFLLKNSLKSIIILKLNLYVEAILANLYLCNFELFDTVRMIRIRSTFFSPKKTCLIHNLLKLDEFL